MAKKKKINPLITILIIIGVLFMAQQQGFLGAVVDPHYDFTWKNISFICTGGVGGDGDKDEDFSDGTASVSSPQGSSPEGSSSATILLTDFISMRTTSNSVTNTYSSSIDCNVNFNTNNMEKIVFIGTGTASTSGGVCGAGVSGGSVNIFGLGFATGQIPESKGFLDVTIEKRATGVGWVVSGGIHQALIDNLDNFMIRISSSASSQCSTNANVGLSDIVITCEDGFELVGIECIQTISVFGDTDGDGIVDRNELEVAISDWINGIVTREQLGGAIDSWASA